MCFVTPNPQVKCIHIYVKGFGFRRELTLLLTLVVAAAPPPLNWHALSATGTFLGAAGAASCFLEEAVAAVVEMDDEEEDEEEEGSLDTIRVGALVM